MRRYFFWLALLFASLSFAENSVDKSSFSELLKSPEVFSDNAVSEVSNSLWQKYLDTAQKDSVRKTQHEQRRLVYGDKAMRFSLDKIGEPKKTGYPVYIALHGGGTAPAYVNDSQWQHMKVYYKDSVDNGIYVATRGVSDTWNLHFMDESYALYDRLIENLIAYEGADPNRIYFLGFSAGGDGVYQVVPRMPDRFAAANMSAGHHNWIRFDNLLNTPFLMQVGERDGAYSRNKVAAENYVALDALSAQHQGYVHDLFIHTNGNHNGWYDNDPSGQNHSVMKNPKAWLLNNDRTEAQKNTNAVHWLKNYERATLPSKVIWDLSTRSPRSKTWGASYGDQSSDVKATRDLFYWLEVSATAESGRIEAEVNIKDNAVMLKEVTNVDTFKILLSRDLFDFSRPVKVFFKGAKIAQVNPEAKMSVMARTLLERGDRSFMFEDEIEVSIPKVGMRSVDPKTFVYCTDGRCTYMSPEEFKAKRNFPLDLNYTCQKNHQYAMTFDDGPGANFPEVLRILEKHNVKATFFVNGMNLEGAQGKDWAKRAADAGHQIANHTYYHKSLVELSKEEVAADLKKTEQAILEATGDSAKARLGSKILRPPFGNISPEVQEVVNDLGFYSVRWNSDRYDWKLSATDGQTVKDRLKQHLTFRSRVAKDMGVNRSILDLNHDGSMATLSVLDEMISMIKEGGFDMVTVSECLGLDEGK